MAKFSIFSYARVHSLARPIGRVEQLGVVLVMAGILLSGFSARASLNSESYEESKTLLAKRKWAEAAIVLRRIVKEAPEFTEASLNLSKALVYSGRREEALSVLSQAASHERGAQRALLNRRLKVLSRLFLTSETFQAYQDGLNLAYGTKYRAALDRFEKALEREPDNVEILLRMGQCFVMEGDYDSAAERLRLARKLNPNESQIRLWLGRALHQRGELLVALEELRSVQAELPATELAPVWLAEALVSAGQRAGALQALRENVRVQPFHLLSLVTLARLEFAAAARDKAALWGVRKNLQVALSRYDRYALPSSSSGDGDLGLRIQSPEKLKEEIQSLLQRVDSRIEGEAERQ